MSNDEVNLNSLKLLNRRQVAEALGRTPDTLDDWVAKGLFPAPIQAFAGAPKQWRWTVVQSWIEKRSRACYRPPAKRGRLKQHAN
jgi:predicted DNA-binding transcriptional regulator AlpA